MLAAIRDFLRLEAASGVVLMLAAIAALAIANSPLASLYAGLINVPVEIRVGGFEIAKPLLLWINDGLMSLFFLLVGLELKREFLDGELAERSRIILPASAAVGGMIVPALIYTFFNHEDAAAMQGWAIPAATDIAFALAILALLGKRVPLSLRMFLVTIAILDDIGAIAIIALFYSSELSVPALAIAAACLPVLFFLNRRGVIEKTPYLLIGVLMWVAVLKSGVHATLAGVVLAMFIPLRNPEREPSPLHELEHDLHTAVAFGVLPLFAFANAGVALGGLALEQLLHPVPLGIFAGLFLGKQLGVFTFCWLALKSGVAQLPAGLGWPQLYGVALLCGVGFTMSLFIGSLAFERTGVDMLFDERLGIIAGSTLSGLCGYFVLRACLRSAEPIEGGLKSPG